MLYAVSRHRVEVFPISQALRWPSVYESQGHIGSIQKVHNTSLPIYIWYFTNNCCTSYRGDVIPNFPHDGEVELVIRQYRCFSAIQILTPRFCQMNAIVAAHMITWRASLKARQVSRLPAVDSSSTTFSATLCHTIISLASSTPLEIAAKTCGTPFISRAFEVSAKAKKE